MCFVLPGNKCYKLVYRSPYDGSGATWDEAVAECRAESGGLRPDLASIVDQYQMCLCPCFLLF